MPAYHLKKLERANALSIGRVLDASAALEIKEIAGLRLGGIHWKASHRAAANNGWRVFALATNQPCHLAIQIAEQLDGQVFTTRGQALEAIEVAVLFAETV